MSTESTRAASRWITRILPLALAAAVGYTTYVTVVRSCGKHIRQIHPVFPSYVTRLGCM
jgi:palmitoyltransferase